MAKGWQFLTEGVDYDRSHPAAKLRSLNFSNEILISYWPESAVGTPDTLASYRSANKL